MALRSDLPRTKADEALLTLVDLHGQEGALDWLEERAAWFRVAINLKLGRRPVEAHGHCERPAPASAASAGADVLTPSGWMSPAAAASANADATIAALKKALGWYADPINWQPRKKTPAPTVADAGELARETLLEVEGGNGDDE